MGGVGGDPPDLHLGADDREDLGQADLFGGDVVVAAGLDADVEDHFQPVGVKAEAGGDPGRRFEVQ